MKKIIFPILFFFMLSGTVVSQTESELFAKGVDLYKKGLNLQAVDTFSQLIALAPEKTDAYRIRGAAYMRLTRYDMAVKDFTKAVTLAPRIDGIYSDLGTAWYYSQNYEKALENYNLEIKNNNKNHLVFFNRALCLEQLEKFDQALEDILTSLRIKPDFYWALCYKGNLLARKGEYKAARAAYEAAIQLENGDPYAQEKLALIQNRFITQEPEPKIDSTQALTPVRQVPDKVKLSNQIKSADPQKEWAIQCGAFRQKANAERMKNRLMKNGFNSRILVLKDNKKKFWYLVRSGYYPDKKTAERVVPLFKKSGIDSVVRPAGIW